MTIRPEGPCDHHALRALHRACFPTPAEAELVDRLRADEDVVISLLSSDQDKLVGYVLLSRMSAPFRALGLGPVAVAEGHRRQGVAAGLIQASILEARARGWQAIFVLGDPAYYARFGFSAELAAGFQAPYAGPYLMALALQAEGLPVLHGRVDYAPAFAGLE